MIISYVVFIILNSKNGIIKDTGLFKNLLFSLGIILFFISIIFSTYTSYLECSMYFSFKHIGITLALVIFYIYISLGHELGIFGYLTNNDKKLYIVNSLSIDSLESIDSSISDIYDIYLSLNNSTSSSIASLHSKENSEVNISKMKTESELHSIKNVVLKNNTVNENVLNKRSKSSDILNNIEERNGTSNTNVYDSFRNKNKEFIEKQRMLLNEVVNKTFNKSDKGKTNKNKNNIHKNIEKAHSLFLETLIIYPLFILLTIILAVIYFHVDNSEEKNIIQSKNGQWFYKCSLENLDIAYNALEIMILVMILIKGKYVIMIAIALGPLINIISFIILSNQKYNKYIFDTTLNSIGYLILFILFSWDKVYYIFKKQGNDPRKYFIIKKYKKCVIHNSFTCGCQLEESDENLEPIIKKYILFYKFCSTFLIINHGKLKYVNMKSKLSITKIDP
ncbi:hypothetical protein PIROE2DRAFT_19184 [Piromyces sp. E2]|nr:hypothetical protein PIROE2DRAFT_19184 [Piromyces sp. E2]|eukprot:OUM56276.1 hypothetical protein PIROE2DRAFT_19184 [Piromyces sp. E2]